MDRSPHLEGDAQADALLLCPLWFWILGQDISQQLLQG